MKNKRILVLLLILCIVFGTAVYRRTHQDEILVKKAELAFKKNEVIKAQAYMEEAFDLGVNNYKLRELYVNSIINGPFDENSQKKLIKFLENPTDDMARFNAEYFLQSFRIEINKKYPYNYITQAAYNQQIMRWSTIPITYDFINIQNVPQYFITEIENAFTKWETATEHQILFIKENDNPNIIINFKSKNPALDKKTTKYVVAYTTPELSLHELKHSTINFYTTDASGKLYSQNQVYNTALHEIVHAMGVMGHSSDKNDIMHSTKDSEAIINDTREEPSIADINTVKLLYKIKPDITNSTKPSGEYIPFVALGSADIIYNAKRQEAVNYIQKAPKLASGYIDLADSYAANKDYTNAEKSLKKALTYADSEETKGMIYYNLAVVSFYSESYIKAEKYLLASMQINDNDDSRYLLAEIYSKKDFNKAIIEYQKLIRKNPHNIEYTIALTNLYIQEKQYFNARKTLKNYFLQNPNERNNKRFNSYGIIKLFL